jgi:hypothetical protein
MKKIFTIIKAQRAILAQAARLYDGFVNLRSWPWLSFQALVLKTSF